MQDSIDFTNTEKVLREFAQTVVELYKDELLRDKAVATGRLADSVSFTLVKGDTWYAVDLSLEHYWQYLEYGTAAHFPPHLPIYEWVKAKPILPSPSDHVPVHRKTGMAYTEDEMQHRIAWRIQRTIAKHGTKARHTLKRTLDSVVSEFEGALEEALTADLGGFADVMLKSFVRNTR